MAEPDFSSMPDRELHGTIRGSANSAHVGAAQAELDRRQRAWQNLLVERQLEISATTSRATGWAALAAGLSAFAALITAAVALAPYLLGD